MGYPFLFAMNVPIHITENNEFSSIMVVGVFHYHWYAEACAKALENLGIKVHRLDLWRYHTKGILGRIQRWFDFGPLVKNINNIVIKEVQLHKPEITFFYNVIHLRPATLQFLSSYTWVAGYANDNPFGGYSWRYQWRTFRNTIPYYHSWHIYRESNINEFKTFGARNVHLLMSYYLPWEVNKECLQPRSDFIYDVSFVGHCEADGRVDYIQSLINEGISVRIFGNPSRWKRYLPGKTLRKLPPIKEVSHERYREIVRRSKICLVFLSRQNRDQYTRRCFEIPSWGGFMMCQRTSFLKKLYKEGFEAEFFSTVPELVSKCHYYLFNDIQREHIAQQGQKKCFSEKHDVVSRMKQWLDDIAENKRNTRNIVYGEEQF